MKCLELSDLELSKIRDVITNKYVLLKNNVYQGMIPLKDLRISKSDSFIITDKLGYTKEYNKFYEIVYSSNILMVYSYDNTVVDFYHLLIDLTKFADYYSKSIQPRILISLLNDNSNYIDLENYFLIEQIVDECIKKLKNVQTSINDVIKLKINKTDIQLAIQFDNLDSYLNRTANEIECSYVLTIERMGIELSAKVLNYLFKSLDTVLTEKSVSKW